MFCLFHAVEDVFIIIEGWHIAKEVSPKIAKMSCTDSHNDKEVMAGPNTTQELIVWSHIVTLVMIFQFWSQVSKATLGLNIEWKLSVFNLLLLLYIP